MQVGRERLQAITVDDVLRGLGGERWYRDGPPAWRQTRNDRPAMTSEDARRQRLRDVKMLRRHGKDDDGALRLANKVAACGPKRRCLSPFCGECMRANQRLFVAMACDLLGRSAVHATVVSVVAWNARVGQGELARGDLFETLARQLRRALSAGGVRQAFGGFDVSANEHATQRFAPHFRPHAWLFVPAQQMARCERVFRESFPASRIVRRPVRMQRFDGDPRGLAYALKADFARRISIPRQALPNGDIARRNTRLRPLLARQKMELALALDKIGLGARIFLHGLRMVEVGGVVRLKKIDSALHPKIEGHGRARASGNERTARVPSATSVKNKRAIEVHRGPRPRWRPQQDITTRATALKQEKQDDE